jgi:hypothetical protein
LVAYRHAERAAEEVQQGGRGEGEQGGGRREEAEKIRASAR